ncbi:elongation factor EF-Tu-like protein [Scenedesmus sp. NREL 46B-D3]|nr:elongation factor EF-Tu-like protein [Scenedesmus sp. NREL 46B-D3]
MEDSHYDEFGNYIGPALSDSDQEEEEEEEEQQQQQLVQDEDDDEAMHDADDAGPHMGYAADDGQKYYPTAEETYGAETETLVMEEDAQPLETPIIAAVVHKRHEKLLDAPLPTRYSGEFLAALSSNPELIRNVAVVGGLHHGKTTLLDMLVEQTHDVAALGIRNQQGKQLRFTDTRVDEQARGISIKAMPMSLVLEGGTGKSYLANLIDCPGHVNFNDEVTAAMRLADGVLLVVDVLEGMGSATERAIQQAVQEGLAITMLVSKVRRGGHHCRFLHTAQYHCVNYCVHIEEANAVIRTAGGGGAANGAANGAAAAAAAGTTPLLDPVVGNVAFASCAYGYSFTLRSFAQLYKGVCGDAPKDVLLVDEFARRLWGDVWYYAEERVFRRKPPQLGADRSFVTFILEPLYKLTSAVVGEHPKTIERLLGDEFGIHLKSSAYSQDVKPLLKEVCSKVFGSATGITDMLVQHDPSSTLMQFMTGCSRTGPLVMHVAKLFPKNDASSFDAYGRIFSGTLRPGDEVRVLGEGFTPDDDEDSGDAVVSNVWLYQARYRVPMAKVTAGNLVLVEGLDALISKTATVVGRHLDEEVHVFKPLRFQTRSVMKIATEPLQPSELPKMVEGLRKINKSYPLAVTRVEESGEHTLLGTGELYLDSIMRDLREMYAVSARDIEVKVADPVVAFCETVVETSSLKCFAETPNRKNKVTMIAEPLDKGLAEDIESGKISITWPARKLGTYLVDTYEWDPLAARSVWAFGPAADGPNVLLDDTLAGEVDKGLLGAVRDSIVQGFQWGTREGPLCDEPIRNVKFKVTDALIADEPLHRGGGQVIPTARRVCYSAFLMATPRLMEPMYYVEIQTPADCIAAIYNVLAKRRGHVTKDLPRPGTPIFTVKAYLPVVESFGFETDLRYHTQGQAFCQCVFDHWAVVPGDPLDRSVVLRPLEPAPVAALAREFCVKTRRRKGMSEDVSVAKFFDDPMLLELAKQDTEFQQMAF